MRTKIITFLMLAGTVVGCASNPPPPPPMAMAPVAPAPAPMPMASGPVAGIYRGTPTLADGAPRACAKPRPTTVRVMRNNTFTVMGMRGMVGPDGNISGGRRSNVSGNVSGDTMNLTAMKGRCSYSATLTKG